MAMLPLPCCQHFETGCGSCMHSKGRRTDSKVPLCHGGMSACPGRGEGGRGGKVWWQHGVVEDRRGLAEDRNRKADAHFRPQASTRSSISARNLPLRLRFPSPSCAFSVFSPYSRRHVPMGSGSGHRLLPHVATRSDSQRFQRRLPPKTGDDDDTGRLARGYPSGGRRFPDSGPLPPSCDAPHRLAHPSPRPPSCCPIPHSILSAATEVPHHRQLIQVTGVKLLSTYISRLAKLLRLGGGLANLGLLEGRQLSSPQEHARSAPASPRRARPRCSRA